MLGKVIQLTFVPKLTKNVICNVFIDRLKNGR